MNMGSTLPSLQTNIAPVKGYLKDMVSSCKGPLVRCQVAVRVPLCFGRVWGSEPPGLLARGPAWSRAAVGGAAGGKRGVPLGPSGWNPRRVAWWLALKTRSPS